MRIKINIKYLGKFITLKLVILLPTINVLIYRIIFLYV